jgi:hypothetical protein
LSLILCSTLAVYSCWKRSLICAVLAKFDVPLSRSTCGSGTYDSIFWAIGLIRFAGMTLPGNGWCVSGS